MQPMRSRPVSGARPSIPSSRRTEPTRRPQSAPNRIQARSYSLQTSHDKIYDRALDTMHAGGTRAVNIICDTFVRRWKQEADRSKLYNLLPGRKVEGKSLPNRIEFTAFMKKIFSNFSDHMSPAWQNYFIHQLNDLPFKEAYKIYDRLCVVTKEYVDLTDELKGLEAKLKEASLTGTSMTDEQFNMYLRTVEIESLQQGLNAKMNSIASDCVLRASLNHTKKTIKLESQPSKLAATRKKVEQVAGKSTQEMRGLINLQNEYVKKMDELANIDKILFPKEYAAKEEECKNCMQGLLDIVKLDPSKMAEIAFKFERKYRTQAEQKLDPNHFVYTEYKILSELQNQALSILLIALLTSVAGWLILDKLKHERKEVEGEINNFVEKATSKHQETTLDLSQLRKELNSLDIAKHPSIISQKEELEERTQKLEQMNEELKLVIASYKAAGKQHLESNIVSNLHKINNYSSYKEFLKFHNDELNKRGFAVTELAEKISHEYLELQKGYKSMHYNLMLDRCDQDLNDLKDIKLTPEKKHKLTLFVSQLNKFKRMDIEKVSEATIRKIEVFSSTFHHWKKKQFHDPIHK